MGNTRRKPENIEPPKRRGRPAMTPQDRENQLIQLAVDVTEEQMRKGTASAQQITHFLKLGSSRERLEQDRIGLEKELMAARVAALESEKRVEELYENAITAMRGYRGDDPEEYYD